ncbi:MAG: ankyrin repeat domain-containing protein [Pseudomonadota bacterium]
MPPSGTHTKDPLAKLTGKISDFSGIVLKTAAAGKLDDLKVYLEHEPRWLNERGPHGRTLLWEAARKGRLDTVQFLLASGAQADLPATQYTPMLAEVSPIAAAQLEERTAVITCLTEHGCTTDLHDRCYLGEEDGSTLRSEIALATTPKKECLDDNACLPLYYAIAGYNEAAALACLEIEGSMGANPGLALRWAVWRELMPVVDRLLELGVTPAQSGVNAWAFEPTMKELAEKHGHDVDPDMPDAWGFPTLVDACRGNHNMPDDPERVALCLAAGANVNAVDHKGKTGLHRAAQAGHVRIMNLLITNGATIDQQDHKGETPLFEAIKVGRLDAVQLLVDAGATADDKSVKAANKHRTYKEEILAILPH